MATEAPGSSSSPPLGCEEEEEDELMKLYGSESGWVEARTACDHLGCLSSDLSHIPTPHTSCLRCEHPSENWVCLSCKEVLCSRFVNKHMLQHFQHSGHSLALSYSCDAYLDAQVIVQLRPVYETAYILKFGEAPPFRSVEGAQNATASATSSSSPSSR